jgi:hypothetical protein
MKNKKKKKGLITHLGHVTLSSCRKLLGLGLEVSDNVGGLLEVSEHFVQAIPQLFLLAFHNFASAFSIFFDCSP